MIDGESSKAELLQSSKCSSGDMTAVIMMLTIRQQKSRSRSCETAEFDHVHHLQALEMCILNMLQYIQFYIQLFRLFWMARSQFAVFSVVADMLLSCVIWHIDPHLFIVRFGKRCYSSGGQSEASRHLDTRLYGDT